MKGLQERTDSNSVFLVVKHHSICQESKKERDGFEPIEVTNPRTNDTFFKFIKRYKAVEALVKRIEWYDTESRYDTRYMGWKIHLDANGTPCVLDLPFESRVSTRFMNLAENVDFTQPVEFKAWHDAKNDSTAFMVAQNGKSVPQKYTKDNPGNRPPPKQKFGGKWNYDEQTEFLHNQMMTVVIPKLQAVVGLTEERTNGNEFNPRPTDPDPEYPYQDEGPEF